MRQEKAAGKQPENQLRRTKKKRKGPAAVLPAEKRAAEKKQEPGTRAQWKPGNMIYPVPAVLVTVADAQGNSNIITIAWTGTICTNPPMAYISVRPERYSYHMLRESGEFVINLATESMAYATDYCGVRSGRDVDKWKETGLTPVPAATVKAPVIAESPVAIECRVTEVKELGSHHMFLAEVTGVSVDEQWLSERGSLELSKAKPIVYSHGGYYGLSELFGTFGWSVKKSVAAKAGAGQETHTGNRKKTSLGQKPSKGTKAGKPAAVRTDKNERRTGHKNMRGAGDEK